MFIKAVYYNLSLLTRINLIVKHVKTPKPPDLHHFQSVFCFVLKLQEQSWTISILILHPRDM